MSILDIVVNLWTKEITEHYPDKLDEFWRWVKIYDETKAGIPLDEELARMDRAGIDKGLLVATTGGKPGSDEFFEKPYQKIQSVIEAHPKRFKGILGVNPYSIVPWLEKLDHAVQELGFVGAHVYPHWYGAPPTTVRTTPSTLAAPSSGCRSRSRWATPPSSFSRASRSR